MKTVLKIAAGLLLILVLIQLIPVETTNPPVDQRKNFATLHQTDAKTLNILQRACYDCHSNETKYPAYSHWAPLSWSIRNHIIEGREHGNFSTWADLTPEAQITFLQKSIEEIREKEMPLPGYLPLHPEANISAAERQILINYFQNILTQKMQR